MEEYIPKSALVAEIERIKEMYCYDTKTNASFVAEAVINSIDNAIDTLEVKEVNLIDRKTDWHPSQKQIESLHDMLKYNIGVFDYQKFMEVNSLYDDLKNI